VAELVEREGVVAHSQLIRLGLSARTITRWVSDGRLHRVHRGVYAVGHPALTDHGRRMAAVKACGPGAVLSHQTAADLWGLRRSSSPAIHVTTPGRGSPRGIRVRRVRRLHPDDLAECDGIPVTSVARTLLDLAAVLPQRQLIRAIEQAERLRRFDLGAIERLIERSRGRPGVKALRAALRATGPEPPRVNSAWERDFLDFCADLGIPRPELNVIVEGYEVDALWRDEKVIVELDSWTFHRFRTAFEEDRRKVCRLQLKEYRVLPFTTLDEEAAQILSAAIAAR
jgi:hypothetical protein